MGGKNKKHRGGSGAAGAGVVHPATVAAARAKAGVAAATAECGAAGEAAGKRPPAPRPSPGAAAAAAAKDPRLKQGMGQGRSLSPGRRWCWLVCKHFFIYGQNNSRVSIRAHGFFDKEPSFRYQTVTLFSGQMALFINSMLVIAFQLKAVFEIVNHA